MGLGDDLGLLGEEEEVGGQTGPEQNQTDEEDETGTSHEREKDGAESRLPQGYLGRDGGGLAQAGLEGNRHGMDFGIGVGLKKGKRHHG